MMYNICYILYNICYSNIVNKCLLMHYKHTPHTHYYVIRITHKTLEAYISECDQH